MWSWIRSGLMALRLAGVEGAKGLRNDLVYCPPLQQCSTNSEHFTSTVVFFPGDVQNYIESMKNDSENFVYLKWNLIDTALMLQNHFKLSHIVIVKPSRTEFNVYSCYDNFLRCDRFGAPQKVAHYIKTVPHLEGLLMNVAGAVQQEHGNSQSLNNDGNSTCSANNWNPLENAVILIGFSKGCVVLNQLVLEICKGADSRFLKDRIYSVSWLDGGHGGTSGAWITEADVLSTLSTYPWKLFVEVTPYQVERREWVKQEEKEFTETLVGYGANIQRRLHFASYPPSLLNHFRILDVLYNDT